VRKWKRYHDAVIEGPNSLTVSALDYVHNRESALDIGAGNLRDARLLVDKGFKRVIAVDSSEISLDYPHDGIDLHIARIQDFEMGENQHDLVVACNVLFFLGIEEIQDLFTQVLTSLRSGGVFACNVLGMRDEIFSADGRRVFFTVNSLLDLIHGCYVIGIGEREGEGRSPSAPPDSPLKHYHTMNLMVRKL